MPYKDPERQRQNYNAWYQRNRERVAAKKDELRRKNPERYKGYQAKAKKTRRQALAEYKLEKGCAICGYRGHPEALEFDHLPGTTKRDQISYMYRSKWEDVVKEIAKCQVLCANCHAIETASRRREKAAAKRQDRAAEQLRLKLA